MQERAKRNQNGALFVLVGLTELLVCPSKLAHSELVSDAVVPD